MTDYSQTIIDLGYIVASILFILGIKMLGKPERARMGNLVSALGMLIAITAVLFECCISFEWVIVGLIIGSLIGVIAARTVQMTAMPQMVAILNGFGGIASLLVGWENFHSQPDSNLFVRVAILLAAENIDELDLVRCFRVWNGVSSHLIGQITFANHRLVRRQHHSIICIHRGTSRRVTLVVSLRPRRDFLF